MDHLNFAMEWIVSWRIPGNRGDLTEQVHLKWRIANRKIHQSMNNLRKLVRIEKTTDCRGLWYFRAEHWMADITAADVQDTFDLANPKIYVSPEARKPKQGK
jgi:hypothetical protein